MALVEREVQAKNGWREDETLAASAAMFEVGAEALAVAARSPKDCARRVGQLTWQSVAKELRGKTKALRRAERRHTQTTRAAVRGREEPGDDDNEDDERAAPAGTPSKRRLLAHG